MSRHLSTSLKIPKLRKTIKKIHWGVIGEDKSGKTSLINAFISKTFKQSPKEETIISSHKLSLTIKDNQIELIITEINLNQKQNDKIIKDLIKSMDIYFICHQVSESDWLFNEEIIKRYIQYITNTKDDPESVWVYIIGCKLDKKIKEIKQKTVYIFDNENKLTVYGQRVKTFATSNKIEKFFWTSALWNYNVTEVFEHALYTYGMNELSKQKIIGVINKEQSNSLITGWDATKTNQNNALVKEEEENEVDCLVF